ncbi:MAG: septal ring lytic transglycosylase RlpA family protein [Solirubrobacteraceae bacterium]
MAVVSSGPPTLTRAAATTLKLRDAQLNVLDGHRASVAGTLIPGLAGRVVAIQALGKHGWSTIARTHTGPRGSFELNLVPRQIGSERVRLRFAGDALAVAAGLQLGNLNVYRLAEASWYGGGGEMACGGSLTSSTLGVASKTLPCGTLVTFRYGGRSVRVPVVDRGPYVAGREFDLTEAVKQALGFGETGEVWSTS